MCKRVWWRVYSSSDGGGISGGGGDGGGAWAGPWELSFSNGRTAMLRPTAAESSCPVSLNYRARGREIPAPACPGSRFSRVSSRREFSASFLSLSLFLSFYPSLTVAPVASFTRLTDWLGWLVGLSARMACSCLLCVDWMRIGWARNPQSSTLPLARFSTIIRPPPLPTRSPPFCRCRHRCRRHRPPFRGYSSVDSRLSPLSYPRMSRSSTCSSQARDLLSISALDTLARRDLAASSPRGLFWSRFLLSTDGRNLTVAMCRSLPLRTANFAF